MAIDGGRGYASFARSLLERKPCRSTLFDEREAALDQRLAQIAVMIAAFRHARGRDLPTLCRRWALGPWDHGGDSPTGSKGA